MIILDRRWCAELWKNVIPRKRDAQSTSPASVTLLAELATELGLKNILIEGIGPSLVAHRIDPSANARSLELKETLCDHVVMAIAAVTRGPDAVVVAKKPCYMTGELVAFVRMRGDRHFGLAPQ